MNDRPHPPPPPLMLAVEASTCLPPPSVNQHIAADPDTTRQDPCPTPPTPLHPNRNNIPTNTAARLMKPVFSPANKPQKQVSRDEVQSRKTVMHFSSLKTVPWESLGCKLATNYPLNELKTHSV